MQAAEEGLGRFTPECLEAALGVVELRQGHQAHEGIEDSAHQVPVGRLIITNRAHPLPRADGYLVMSFEVGQELLDLLYRGRQVRVRVQDEAPAGLEHTGAHGITLAAMRVAYQA